MCYLKKFEKTAVIPATKSTILDDTDNYSSDESILNSKNDDIIFDMQKVQKLEVHENKSNMLMNLFSLLNYNTSLMDSLQMKINKNNEALDTLSQEIVQKSQKNEPNGKTQVYIEQCEETPQKSKHYSDQALTQKLFGKKSYKYKLKLSQAFPEIIYKERNISFTVNLTTSDGVIVRNSNMVDLCLGICDNNGQWISQTRNGENFMKGKTQSQLYHGESNYSKIYPRDVSRSYQGGKIHFVVYPKPSMLHYSGNTSSLESKVNFDEIEPLLIKDLTIRAKKKE